MNRKFSIHSLRTQIVLIVLASMSAMLVFHGVAMGNFIIQENRRQRDYIRATNEAIASSLNMMGDNIRSMAIYMASFESFKNLYFPNRTGDLNVADMVSSAFYTVRFIANYYPIIEDVVVVGLNRLPFSYYIGSGYDFMTLMENEYDFGDPDAIESRFFYFEEQDYFIYVTPISGQYSSLGDARKIASCIFICDLQYIKNLLNINMTGLNFSVYDSSGRLVVSAGGGTQDDSKSIKIIGGSDTMGLTVVTSGEPAGTGWGDLPRFILYFFISSSVLLVLITFTVIILLQKKIARPISNLVQNMITRNDKPLHIRLSNSNINELDHIVEGVNNLLNEIGMYTEKSLAAQEKLYEMELRKNEAEIYALQSQINPHFLNNTLQCIRSIAIAKQVDEIANITLAMSELLRYAMNYQEYVFIKDEIEIVRHYVLITNIRFQNRFFFTFDIEAEIQDSRMCRMILQPLVENAVRHGVSLLEGNGTVEIIGRKEGDIISLEVIDNGPGFGEERLREIQEALACSFEKKRELNTASSFGLYNIDRRLKLCYGESYGLEIERREQKTGVRVRFPDLS
jgi:two-component system sensor histidine kinase YesM